MVWAYSSVVEHYVDIVGVASSILATPTIEKGRPHNELGGLFASVASRVTPKTGNFGNLHRQRAGEGGLLDSGGDATICGTAFRLVEAGSRPERAAPAGLA